MSTSTEILNSDSPLPCPRCDKLFRLPAGFTASNALACPHCQEQVTGQEILDAMVPTATMVEGVSVDTGDPAPNIDSSATEGRRPTRSFDEQDYVIPKPLKTATRRRRSRHPERKTREPADDEATKSKTGSDEATKSKAGSDEVRKSSGDRSRSRSRHSSRKKKKEASPGVEMLKIVFGGLLALPIAQLILWWAFNADPVGLAQPTSKVASFIVPPRLRPAPEIEEEDGKEPRNKDMPQSQKIHDNNIPRLITPN